MEKVKHILHKNANIIYALLLIAVVVFIIFNNKYTFFWFDEGFSISLIQHSYKDIWDLTAKDVHPPLYYYMLKIYSSLIGDSILGFRIFSAIPVFLTALVACFKVRRFWGNKVAVLFIILLLTTPITYYLTSEIRMYSWSMFFVFMTFLYAYQCYIEQKKHSFVLLAIFSLLAAYTHYYGLITVAYIYALLFLLLLINDKKKIPLLLASALLCIIVYAPWLVNLISQVKSVTKDYWITATWLDDIMEFLYPVYILKDTEYSYLYSRIVEILIPATFFIFVLWRAWKSVNDKKKFYSALLILSVFFAPIIVGGLYSVIFRPVFISRYACCFISLYLLGFAILLSMLDLSKKVNMIIPILFFTSLFIFDAFLLKNKLRLQKYRSITLNALVEFVNQDIDDKTVFLYRDYFYYPLAIYPILFPDHTHISKSDSLGNTVSSITDVFPRKKINSYTEIDSTYTRIYILDAIPARRPTMMFNSEDSLEIMKNFEIKRMADFSYSHAYELKRKK